MIDCIKKNKRYVISVAIILVTGISYLFFVRITGFAIPCFFRMITGYKCPGCGITSMFVHISKLQFKEAFYDNQFLFVTWPIILLEIIFDRFLKKKFEFAKKINCIILYVYIALLIFWGILRNVIG